MRKKAPGAAAVHITGNATSRYFGVRALGTDREIVSTIDPYDGIRLLDWDGPDSTGFDVQAGAWTITVLPVAALPAFDSSFEGDGDMVVRYTGDGSTLALQGNESGRYFALRALSSGDPASLVSTTEPFTGKCRIGRGPQLFAIAAIGRWTISIT